MVTDVWEKLHLLPTSDKFPFLSFSASDSLSCTHNFSISMSINCDCGLHFPITSQRYTTDHSSHALTVDNVGVEGCTERSFLQEAQKSFRWILVPLLSLPFLHFHNSLHYILDTKHGRKKTFIASNDVRNCLYAHINISWIILFLSCMLSIWNIKECNYLWQCLVVCANMLELLTCTTKFPYKF